ncbi:YgjV family protein [Aeromonas hydrophila]|uniref:YgjV family protein n=1 Tax=Aeromonas hydrophila TaxID=644 RepID=UPI003F502D34
MGEGGQRWHPVGHPLCRGHHSLLQRGANRCDLHGVVLAIYQGSPVAALMEGLFLVSNLVGYYRHYGRRACPGR